jgi:hypothetical protein
LPRLAKSQNQEWPNPGRWLTEIGQILACDKPELSRPRKINYRDLLVSPASHFAKSQKEDLLKPAA